MRLKIQNEVQILTIQYPRRSASCELVESILQINTDGSSHHEPVVTSVMLRLSLSLGVILSAVTFCRNPCLSLPAATKLDQGNIFTSVCLSGGSPIFQGVSNFSWGDSPIFRGGGNSIFFIQICFLIQIFFNSIFFPKNIFWDAPSHTVTERAVLIILECILVTLFINFASFLNQIWL